MVHEDTPKQIFFHDVENSLGIMAGFTCLAIRELEAEGGHTEVILMLQKALKQHGKVKAMLMEDYLEKLRMERA